MPRFTKLEFETPAATTSASSVTPRLAVDATTWMQRADQARRSGTYESALQLYSRALEDDKTLVRAWVGQVQMLIQLEESPEAEVWSRKALELFPADGDLHAGRAQALGRLHRSKEAYASIDAAMNQPGQSAYRWTVRGELLLSDGQSTERVCFDKAIQTDGDWLVPVEVALVYLEYKQPSNALNRVRLATERDPAAAYAWYVQGVCQAELGLDAPAMRSFQTCLDLVPGHREAEDRLHALRQGGSLWKRVRGMWSK
jgi:Tfp pilus assembly protein PilF